MLPSWLLILLMFTTWIVWHFACVAQVRRDERERGVAVDDRRFVIAMPGVVLFPLVFVFLVYLIDGFVGPLGPWGTWIIGTAHVVFLIVLLGSIAIDLWRIRNSA